MRNVAAIALCCLAVSGCGTTGQSAAVEPETTVALSPKTDAFIRNTIERAKAAGFFANESVPVAVKRVHREYAEEWGEDIDPSDSLSTLAVIGYDSRRVWWRDVEMDVLKGNNAYVATLKEWSRISRGTFRPRNIRETWHGESGPVEVSYDRGNEHVRLEPQYLDDWLDLRVLCAVNRQIAPSGVQLEIVKPFDQTAFLVSLTAAEHERVAQLIPDLKRDACSVAAQPAAIGRGFEQRVLNDLSK